MAIKFIAGPCVIESAELLDAVGERLAAINRTLGTEIIFKASFDKANRTSISSFRGPGLEKGTTSSPELARDIAEAAQVSGRMAFDCPVTGGESGAIAGTLTAIWAPAPPLKR